MDRGCRRESGSGDRVEGEEVGREAGFHGPGATSLQPGVLDSRLEGRSSPILQGPGRNDIHMTLQDQLSALRDCRPIAAYDVEVFVVGHVPLSAILHSSTRIRKTSHICCPWLRTPSPHSESGYTVAHRDGSTDPYSIHHLTKGDRHE